MRDIWKTDMKKRHFGLTVGWIISLYYTLYTVHCMTLSKLNSASQNTQISTLYVKQMPHHRDVCLRRMDNGRTVVNQCVSPVEKSISPRYDVNL